MDIKIRDKTNSSKKVLVEMDLDKFERLAANLGFFSPEFLESLKKAEREYESGEVRKIKSLEELE
tara:strand:+ start:1938 stop:2132 length:195 start_codon:yes stop_codon:yes gene_type:complete